MYLPRAGGICALEPDQPSHHLQRDACSLASGSPHRMKSHGLESEVQPQGLVDLQHDPSCNRADALAQPFNRDRPDLLGLCL